jgi:acetylornithine deacetylase/succinyl-diaminopimelate desuccinylase-like protein
MMRIAILGIAALALPAWGVDREKTLAEFREFLAIPNVASDAENIRKNAEWIRAALERRGVTARVIQMNEYPPLVFGELRAEGAKQTVALYAHYDGQPADAAQWRGSGPWEPSYRGGDPSDPETRLYGRSAADDKGSIMAMLAALDELKSSGRKPSVNLKFVFEGEEEAGSAHLTKILEHAYDVWHDVDYWLICDGPVDPLRRPLVYFGARGVVGMNLTVYGAERELHSGHYGNWAPNAAMLLAELLASMRDATGRVAIARFYDGVEKKNASRDEALEKHLRDELWVKRPEHESWIESVNEPSLNVRGMRSASVGKESRNVVPNEAQASIDIRLVKGVTAREMVDRVRKHVEAQGYFVTNMLPTEAERKTHTRVAMVNVSDFGYEAYGLPMDDPAAKAVIRVLKGWRKDLVAMPTLGGSVPLSEMQKVVRKPMVGVPMANHDNNQHAANENLRLRNLWDGVEMFAALYMGLGGGER